MKLKELAQEATSTALQNIADLKVIATDIEVEFEEDTEFPYHYTVVDNVRYRIPKTVFINLKALLDENPDLKKVKIIKTGEGKNTVYNVIPVA